MKKNSKNMIINKEEIDYLSNNKKKQKYIKQKKTFRFCFYLFFIIITISLSLNFIFTFKLYLSKNNKCENIKDPKQEFIYNGNTPLETYDLNILEPIENKIKGYIELTEDERKFFNGVLRKVKPKKIVEIGVSRGGSSVLILNAIKDIEGAKLYSIDKSESLYINKEQKTGFLVSEKFPELMKNWKLFVGGITAEFIESIGDGIDLVFIDTMHITPGEMLDWLMVLPFLKNEAFVVFHDTFFLYCGNKVNKQKLHTSNNELITYIRGDLILPSYGDKVFFRNIGALKLSPEQKNYYYQYFLALGIQWEYMPDEKDLKIMRDFFMKYYGQKYVEVFDDAVEKNKIYLNKFL